MSVDLPPQPTACAAPAGTTGAPKVGNGGFDDGLNGWVAVNCMPSPAEDGHATSASCAGGSRMFQLISVDPATVSNLRLRLYLKRSSLSARVRITTGCAPTYDQTVVGEHLFDVPVRGGISGSLVGPVYSDDEALNGKSVIPERTWVAYTSQNIKPLLPAAPHVMRIDLVAEGTSKFDDVALVLDDGATPTVSFEAKPLSTTTPLPVEFTATCSDADGTCARPVWHFLASEGPSGFSYPDPGADFMASATGLATTVTFVHGRRQPKSYYAAFTAEDDRGAARTFVRQIYAPTNQPPFVTLTASPTMAQAPATIAFMTNGHDDGWLSSSSLDFGDGTTESGPKNTWSLGAEFSHMYARAGTYQATFTGVDNLGTTTSVTVPIVIYDPRSASITATPPSGPAPLTVQFTATASAPGATIASYAWTFGDGTTSTEMNPKHVYEKAGTYQAALTVTDSSGVKTTASPAIIFAQ